jgi:hypothetical protein
MSLVDPYRVSQTILSRRAATRYAALSAIADRKARADSGTTRSHVSAWQHLRARLVKPA